VFTIGAVRQRPSDSLLRPLIVFTALGVIALVVVAVSGFVVVGRLATDQALADARRLTEVSARVVESRINEGLITGDADSLSAVALVVDAVKVSPIVRVKIWTLDGKIVYSDEIRLIDDVYPLDPEDLESLEAGGVASEVSDLDEPENRFERSFGELIEVYTWIRTPAPSRTPLLFETYQLASSVDDRRRVLLTTFAPVLVMTLIALAILEVPIAWMLARRVRSAQREREQLMQGAIEAADRERRRIAGDLHDGPVQELAGLSMRLSAAAEGAPGDGGSRAPASDVLRDAAASVRASVRSLRSAIVGVYPRNLRTVGLRAALSDLVSATEQRGLATTLDIDADAEGGGDDVDALIFRAAQEALRNAEEHAGASRVDVSLRRVGDRAVLTVVDDGIGIADETLERAREQGHLGLSILADLATSAGGELRVESAAPGTVVTMEVPRR
jgi:two-component system NarL family sensor kinase